MALIDETVQDFQTVDTAATERDVYVFPTSFAQRRLWFLSQLEPEAGAYHIAGAFDLKGPLRAEALARSFDEIVQRHEILRTTFSVLDGEPVQMVALEQPFDLSIVDFRHLPPEDRDAEVDRYLAAELRRPFDLHRGPLLRAGLLQLDAGQHVLYYVMHHIVSDGWSEEILIRELAALYQSFAAGRPSPLDELPIQYGDFAKWQREWLDGDALAELVAYWKERLAGASGVLELPADHPRPEVFTQRGASLGFSLPPRLAAELRALGSREGATLFSVLAAAFATLLSRWSGQDDILLGSPVANRNQMELEGLIGLFLDTVIVRADTAGNPTFRAALARVREAVFGAQEHQSLPFEKLVQELQPARDPGRNPLFQVWLNVQNVTREQPEIARLAEISLRPRPMVPDSVKFDLMLDVQEGDWGLNGSFTYNVDLFEAATIRRLRDHFQSLLEGIVAGPGQRIADLPLLGPGERHQLLVEWNDTGRDGVPHDEMIHDLFAAEAARRGDELAAVAAGETLSFRELDRRANRLARHLRSLGVGPDVPVGVYLPRSLDLLVGILGILKAGGAYLPIDPSYPAERVAFVLADARSPVVLTREVWKEALAAQAPHVVCLDADRAAWEAQSGDALPPGGACGESLAYIIYTSGSTGRPKGVMVSHRSAVRYLRWCLEAYAIERGQGAPVHSSIGFDLTVTSLFAPLLAGRPVTLLPEGEAAEPLEEVLSRRPRFSFVKLTPAHLDLLARTVPPEAAADAAHLLILGGETLPARSLGFWRENAPGVRILNEYGPTEATVGCTTFEAAGATPYPDVPIGRPIADARIHLLDRFQQPVAAGVVGEVYIGGPQVTRGYLHRPGLTAERFVPDPFAGEPGARLYRTGDLARHLPDGNLRLLGRTDHQVKIRGYRIELGEVEAALAEHPGLAEAVVVAREEEGTKRLVAYVVPRPEARPTPPTPPTVDELRQRLAARLPDYMVPAAFVMLDALPLTPHGKVDREALPAPGPQRPRAEQEYVAPRTVLEDTLASIWSAALGVEPVGAHDNFFNLGGDSIRSIQVVALAKEKGLRLSLQQIARFPTVAGLAQEIQRAGGAVDADARTEPFGLVSAEDRARLPEDVEDAYPLSGLQAGMLFHMQESAGTPVFHSINSYFLRLPFDPDAFQRAVLHIAARHANLRTSFDLTGFSEPLQLVHREPRFPVTVDDLRGLSAAEQQQRVEEHWNQEVERPFDLSRAPQLRFHVHWRGDDRFQFTLTENHAVIDGWSLHTVYGEVLTCYLGLLHNGELPALPPLTTTFRDFIHLERQSLESAESAEFWRSKLSDCTVLRLSPLPGRKPLASGTRCRRIDLHMPPDLTEGLRSFARTEALPLKSVLLAAHTKVLGLLAGQTDVVTGLSSNGRPETPDGQRIGGLFLNTLPLRMDVAAGTWRELARRAHEAEIETMPHRRFPLPAIQSVSGHQRLLETSFVYLNFHVMEDVVKTHRIELVDTASGAFIEETNFAVMTAFHHSYTSPNIVFNLTCDLSILSEEQIRALSGHYLAVLRAMAADPGALSEGFSPLSEEERGQVLAWSATAPAPASPRLVHDAFQDRAQETPGRVAVASGGESLTYSVLDRWTNQLARHLREIGVGPESRVGILLDRSVAMVVAVLGVLKAGGAYIPLDPSLPLERLDSLLADAGAGIVLTCESWRERLEDRPAVFLDSENERIALHSEDRLPGGAAPANLAYVIYTSGTTGRPKGVAIEHRQIAGYVAAVSERLELPADAVYAMISTFAADLGNTVLFPSLCGGGTLHVASDDAARDPGLLADLLAGQPIDCLKIVPSHLAALLDHPAAPQVLPRQRLILGGEAADWRLVDRVREMVPGCRIFNHYGPTETTVGVLTERLDGQRPAEAPDAPPLGRPLAHARAYVLDAHQQPVPVGSPGELCLGGAAVGRGYLGQPAHTAERFLPDPFAGEPGGRMYRSGDLARHLADGSFQFLGRADHQVKLRGFRVEPAEIEAVLREHPGVRQAVVRPFRQGSDTALVAYVVSGSSRPADPAELRQLLADRLPAYMVPAAYVALPRLPLTPNGKLDLRALPAPDQSEEGVEKTPPRTPTELQLLQLWEEVLGVQDIGVLDDFFDLGGNSLLSVRLLALVSRQLGHRLPVSTLVESRTIEQMARLLTTQQPARTAHLVTLQPRGKRMPFLCVHPGHGGVSSYLRLARYLGTDQPFYGLQALDLDRESDPYRSVEELAALYLQEVKERWPEGPYLLGGWSFGGLVAFEMAQQLRREDPAKVAGLALIDTRSPYANARLAGLDPELMKAFLLLEHAKEIARISARELPITPEDLVGLDLDQQLDRILQEIDISDALPGEVDPALIRRYLELRIARFQAIKNYQPQVYPGKVTLFRAADVYEDAALAEAVEIYREAASHPTYRWDELCTQPVELRPVPGNHESIVFEPNVQVLARELSRFFSELSLNP